MKIPDLTVTDPAPTRDTMIEVVEEEDWIRTVQIIPTITPATGFVSSPKSDPAVHPPRTLAALPRRLSPRRKK
jgi:hypothetical protein